MESQVVLQRLTFGSEAGPTNNNADVILQKIVVGLKKNSHDM